MRSRCREIVFPGADEALGYRIYPHDLEDDPAVFFHGTSERNLDSIIQHGFWLGPRSGSTSFAHNSELALRYAADARKQVGEAGCVIAVRIPDATAHGMRKEAFGVDVWDLSAMPTVEAFCIIPANYLYQ
jgi:hypothetical protein